MKKILYLHAGAELYGADVILYTIIKEIDKTKFKPFVILPCDGPLVEKLKELNVDVQIMPYPILRRKYFNINGIINYIFNYFKYSKQIAKFSKDNSIDIINVNTIAVLQGIYLKKKTKCKIIYHIHEMIDSPKIIFKYVYKWICKSADKVIVVSDAVKNHIFSITSKKFDNIIVIHNGIDSDKFNINNDKDYLYKELKIPKNSKIVGMIGRINDTKGQPDFIKAMAPIIEEDNSTYGIMIGGTFEGQEWRKDELNILIDSYPKKIKENLKIIDFRTDVASFYNMFDIYVLPSVKYDSFPTVVLEAMASELPIVAYKQGGVCEMVTDEVNGYLVEWKNIDLLNKTIKKLLDNDSQRKLMGKNSKKIQNKLFSINSCIQKIENLYNQN